MKHIIRTMSKSGCHTKFVIKHENERHKIVVIHKYMLVPSDDVDFYIKNSFIPLREYKNKMLIWQKIVFSYETFTTISNLIQQHDTQWH